VRLSLTPVQRRIAERLQAANALLAERDLPPEASGTTWAAVSVILAPEPDAVLLIHRAEREGDPWSGHVGLPGGRQDPGDLDLAATAIRETAEEVGWRLPPDRVLGPLEDVRPRTPSPVPIFIRPYVFAVDTRPPLTLNDEVAQAFWVPLDQLRHPETYRPSVLRVRGVERAFPAYHVAGHVVWGLTERILTSLLTIAD
jgi:8-oxo-dGTP pyrophosphatase MutT (NUDIX family)